MSPSSVALIVNARSRRGDELFAEARSLLDPAESCLCRTADELKERVRAAVSKHEIVAVGGGDGTLSLVARYFVDSTARLAVLPLGTGNALARDLGIPANVAGACEVVRLGRSTEIDLGYASNDYFVNVATVGLSTLIVRELDEETKRRFGRAAYMVAVTRALVGVKPFRARIEAPEGNMDFETLQVVIGNGRFHAGPFPISPDASIVDGRLSIYGLATTSRAAFWKLAWHLRTGRHVDLPEAQFMTATSGTLHASPARAVVIDGEIAAKTPLEFRAVPRAIHVLVPQSFENRVEAGA